MVMDGHTVKLMNDSKLRNAKNLTNLRCINQLTKRFALTTPYLGRGMCDAELEMKLNLEMILIKINHVMFWQVKI